MNIVFITSRFPYPLEKGDKLRAYHHIRHLSQSHDITLVALSEEEVHPEEVSHLERFCSKVHVFVLPRWKRLLSMMKAAFIGESLQIGYFKSSGIKAKIEDLILRENPDHIFCQLVRPAHYVAMLPYPKTLDYMDVFSVGMMQRAERANVFMKPFLRYEATALSNAERNIYKYFDTHSIISEQDRERLPLTYNRSVVVLPNGVDADFFAPGHSTPTHDIVFVGNMGYLPNIEAAEYLVRQVMPHVWDHKANCRVLLAGARPHRRVRRLAGNRVTVSGWMEDIRDAYADGKLFVGAIFSGIGQQNKILEAMAMGLPCITSSIVNNAIGAEHKAQLLVARDALSFAKSVIMLLDNQAERENIGYAARQFIEEKYLWEKQNKTLDELLYQEEKNTSEPLVL